MLLLSSSMMGWAQKPISIDRLFKDFKSAKEAEYVSIPKIAMSLAHKFNKEDEDNEIAKHISSVRVLDLSDCSNSVKNDFASALTRLDSSFYEPMIEVNEDGEQVKLYVHKVDDVFHEILILTADNEDCSAIQLKGKLTEKQLLEYINNDGDLVKNHQSIRK